MSRMRNIATAMMNHVTLKGAFPASGKWDAADTNEDGVINEYDFANAQTGWNFAHPPGDQYPVRKAKPFGMRNSWCVDLLPYLDHSDMYEQWDFARDAGDGSYLVFDTTKIPSLDEEPTGGNSLLASKSLQVFVCPEDMSSVPGQGNLSYVVNGGFSTHWLVDDSGTSLVGEDHLPNVQKRMQENRWRMGLMFLGTTSGNTVADRQHSFGTVKDGLSSTVMLAENVNVGWGSVVPWSTNWACPHPYNTSFRINGIAVGVNRTGEHHPYDYSKSNFAGPNAPPIDPAGSEGGINGDLSGVNEGRFPYPNSFHREGFHVAMCDGSVRFVAETVGPGIWARLVTPAGKELVRPSDGQPHPENAKGRGYRQQPISKDR